ncbi:class I SAM-dependent methyltransferase [Streptosporangium lutulentum]
MSTTALHWISGPDLQRVYAELATVLRPGGLLLNGDHMETDDTTPAIAHLERAVHDRETERAFAATAPRTGVSGGTPSPPTPPSPNSTPRAPPRAPTTTARSLPALRARRRPARRASPRSALSGSAATTVSSVPSATDPPRDRSRSGAPHGRRSRAHECPRWP